MRSKEDAQDYRYFPDPDLPPLVITQDWIERVRSGLPELPEGMKKRFETQYALGASDAAQLTGSLALARYFEAAVDTAGIAQAKPVANWIVGELSAALNRGELDIEGSPVSAVQLGGLVRRIGDGTISGKIAKDVFDAMWAGEAEGDDAADTLIAARGLTQISDAGAIEKIVDDALAANPAIVAEVRAGKEKAFNSLVGQVMKASKGKANPAQVNAILRRKLG